MHAHGPRGVRRRNLLTVLIVLACSLVAAYGLAAGGAQAGQDDAAAPAEDGRGFESKVPERLPVKVKIKSEKSFKDLKNKGWLRELEVEVRNTGSKPIYFVQLRIHMPDVRIGGTPYGASMRYGRRELFYPETPVEPGDAPIMPGESATLKFGEQSVKGYEYGRDEEKLYGDPKKVVVWTLVIKFGDGTALWGPNGDLPPPRRESNSSNAPKPIHRQAH